MTYGTIYGLYHPTSNELKYIGQTRRPLSLRLSCHVSEAKRGSTQAVCAWIRTELAGERPVIKALLEHVPLDQLSDAEDRFIVAYKTVGADLLNGRLSSHVFEATRQALKAGWTEKVKAKHSKTKGCKGPFTDDQGNTFTRIREAAKFHGISPGALSSNLRGLRPKAGGRVFQYVAEEHRPASTEPKPRPPVSQEARIKLSRANGGRGPIMDDLGNVFATVSEAARFHGMFSASVSFVVRGKHSQAHGRRFWVVEHQRET